MLALFVNASILIVAAVAFHGTGHQDVAEIGQAFELLSPLLGLGIASILFAVALLASGLNSTVTATLAGQIVMEGFLRLRLPQWARRLLTRGIAIIPVVVVTALYGEKGTGQLLVLSQVILSMQLPFAVIPLVQFVSDRKKMGNFAIPRGCRGTRLGGRGPHPGAQLQAALRHRRRLRLSVFLPRTDATNRRFALSCQAMTQIAEARRFYAQLMAARAGSTDPRLEEVFATVPREAFLGPGPWTVVAGNSTLETPSADPVHIYQNVLVALDAEKGINNGEPVLHAMWIGKLAPKPGETVTHVGAGTGYYTALLARLVSPGTVTAFELEAKLAARATQNLEPYANVTVIHGDAVTGALPLSDIIYVNAGVVAPPANWLKALKPGGRMIFPWRPAERVGLAVIVTRTEQGFACDPFMRSWFIPCVGASLAGAMAKIPDRDKAARSRSIWLTADKAPDRTAIAIIDDVWFSSESRPAVRLTSRAEAGSARNFPGPVG